MTYKIEKQEKPKYWCAYSEDLRVFHIGILDVGLELATGQPHLEYFDTEEELEKRVDELKSKGYYRKQKIDENVRAVK